MTTIKKTISLWLLAIFCLFFGTYLQAQNNEGPQTEYDVIDNRIDVHAQRSILRLMKGNDFERTIAIDIYRWVKSGELAGVYVIDQGVPALRASKHHKKGWWTMIPKGEGVILMEGPTPEPPLLAMAKWILPNNDYVDQALIEGWAMMLTYKKEHKKPFPPVDPSVPLAEDFLKQMGDLFGWNSRTKNLVRERFTGS